MSDTISQALTALSNPTRRELVRLLLELGPQPVQPLAAHFEMRRPSVSEHLKVLRGAGLVGEERRGRQRVYRLRTGALLEVVEWLAPYERFCRRQPAEAVDGRGSGACAGPPTASDS
ncbi:ArsR/SmtB family transcription factor [Salinactinospora qingdaonensis]|uniref:Metalloregulator ArsR/SmtB family transcription factor n=1 Tax=Salinactinospora qingdaonensis TaxID=702744 RepID=A0ABP7G8F6_9ACTN